MIEIHALKGNDTMDKKKQDREEAVDISENVTEIKNSLEQLQQHLLTYAKDNPGKTIGFSLLAGALLAQLFKSRK